MAPKDSVDQSAPLFWLASHCVCIVLILREDFSKLGLENRYEMK